ncbi:MAG: hypothetical protein ACM3UT_10760 [Chloroflexota bacterium]
MEKALPKRAASLLFRLNSPVILNATNPDDRKDLWSEESHGACRNE